MTIITISNFGQLSFNNRLATFVQNVVLFFIFVHGPGRASITPSRAEISQVVYGPGWAKTTSGQAGP